MQLAVNRGNAAAREAFTVTLEKMARGGVYDQLAGGFHRYSVDERWVVPHFEKMLYDNTELLRNYVHGFQSFVREDFRQTAREIVAWLDAVMTDRERGGFYASQDADIGLDDDGDYFTWTLDEARAVLSSGRTRMSPRSIGTSANSATCTTIPPRMCCIANTPSRNLPRRSDKPVERTAHLSSTRRGSKSACRAHQRPTPFIDRTLYTGWNAMAVTAYLEAARVLRIEPARASLRCCTLTGCLPKRGTAGTRSITSSPIPRASRRSDRVPGTLDDYAFTVHACIDAWLASGEMRFYHAAVKLADAMIARFYDRTAGAFYDTAAPAEGTAPLGALGARRKPLQDSPTPAGNPTAAAALLRLEASQRPRRNIAKLPKTRSIPSPALWSTSASTPAATVSRSSGCCSIRCRLLIVGTGAEADRLEATAVAGFAVNKTVMRFAPRSLCRRISPRRWPKRFFNVPAPAE